MGGESKLLQWLATGVFACFALGMIGAAVGATIWVRRGMAQSEPPAKVVAREAEIWLEELNYRRNSRKYRSLTCTEKLTLESEGKTFPQTVKRSLAPDTFFTGAFLDTYRPGTKLRMPVDAVEPWPVVVGMGALFLVFGWFAWILWPLARGRNPMDGVGVKFAAMGLAMIACVGGALYWKYRQGEIRKLIPWVEVSGLLRQIPLDEAIRELESEGVRFRPDVKPFFARRTVYFCEYEYGGRKWRSQSLFCQGTEGERVPARVNPANPRDVLWPGQPESE